MMEAKHMQKAELLAELALTRKRTRELITSLDEQQLDVPYHPGVNPPLWEMGHAAFFYEVFVFSLLDGDASFDPSMDDLWDSFHIDHQDRWRRDLFPGLKKTLAYFDHVYAKMAGRIERTPLTDRELYLCRYAIYHQNMHIESLVWCRQTVGFAPPPGASFERPAPSELRGSSLGDDAIVPAGDWLIGMPGDSEQYATEDFAFDAEKPRHAVSLDEFAISRCLVSNHEFMAFVEDGGYQKPELWSFGGQKWLRTDINMAPQHPVYWRWQDNQWQEKLFDQWQSLSPDAPVTHVSYWEAEAYCCWAGRRLPTEQEWEVAALGNRKGETFQRYPWGNELPDAVQADMNATGMAQNPVSDYPAGDSPFGCRQMIGSVWEWTSSQFFPYDGFCIDMYPFMSTLQFGDHKVSRGGGCATSFSLIRGTYRQAYLPQRNDVYTGFRTCALPEG
ncbi:selenoneine synthase SenA [Marinobacter sp. LV10R510-11A]|uniref:selenoneine synthase SenA n=1 Tax=Marinobacter sp. LV10R510-11A TaxID=1415568 RepID=UPI001D0D66A0|nr:selenoneine synthase SenA [Marinobacter sp. LV10R510-11A]